MALLGCLGSDDRSKLLELNLPSSITLDGAQSSLTWENCGKLTYLEKKKKKKRGISARLILQSPTARYAFGFFTESSGIFTLAIYDTAYPLENDHVVRRIWCANNDKGMPFMVKENAKLSLAEDGNLFLSYGDGKIIWSSTSSNKGIIGMNLLDTGNLVLYDSVRNHVWESFKFPVDTMLPGQVLNPGMKLVSGIFTLKMEVGGLVLYSGSSVKWFWSFYNLGDLTDVIYTCKKPTYAKLTEKGLHLSQNDSSMSKSVPGVVETVDPIVVPDGYKAAGLRLSNYGSVHIDVECPKAKARNLLSKNYLLSILEKFKSSDSTNVRPVSTSSSDAARSLLSISEQGESSTADDTTDTQVNSSTSKILTPSLPPAKSIAGSSTSQGKRKAGISLAAWLGAAALAIFGTLCFGKKIKKKNAASKASSTSIKDILPQSVPAKFSFRKVRKITNNFSTRLGDGGFGVVYSGILKDGSKVAVKMLERTSTQGEKEFKAEVSAMAAIRHVNAVRMRGYCAQGTRRILVYDFMPNGSLDKWLFITPGKDIMLDWSRRYSIALGTARGLAYLHEECSQQIIHLDVKPENILLDKDFVPKVADFGLAKLMDRDHSRVVTNMRGTPGYLAPEWLHGSSVTTKADVYSFGMVLLELICGRETIDLSKGSEQWYLPAWAVRLVEEGRTIELIDQQLHEEVEYFYEDQAKRSIRVALCCIQEDPTQRPSMGRVVQMLEGVIEPKVPQLTKLNVHPSCAATRVKDKLVAYAAALGQEGAAEILSGGPRHSGKEAPSWGLKGGLGTIVGSARTVLKARNVPCIPPWPLKGDVVVVRGSGTGGEYTHAVVRDVKIRSQQVKLAVLKKMEETPTEPKWEVMEEETVWRQWSVLVRTLEFWVPVDWSTLPGCGPQKYPIKWIAN